MSVLTTSKCGFCGEAARGAVTASRDSIDVECVCCGNYRISSTADDLLARKQFTERQHATLAYAVRRISERADRQMLTSDWINEVLRADGLPSPQELLDSFVLWAGANSPHAGRQFQVEYPAFKAILGVENVDSFNFVAEWIDQSRWFSGMRPRAISVLPIPVINCALTPLGWERYRDLSTSRAGGTAAFMAMKFSNEELTRIVREHFAPEIGLAGYKLRRLDDGQPAGLIDDQLRVAIRTARLLICDLTDGNAGAYWEAGFAEGLGKPVIYTCRRDVFEDKRHGNHPHFDTNHMVTVPWDPDDPRQAARQLKATIRATLPSEARLVD